MNSLLYEISENSEKCPLQVARAQTDILLLLILLKIPKKNEKL